MNLVGIKKPISVAIVPLLRSQLMRALLIIIVEALCR